MTIDVTAKLDDVKIIPSNEIEEIAQNVRMIISTAKFSVPMDRGFGINAELLDLPLNVAQTRLSSEIATAIREQEPRAKLQQVVYSGKPDDGQLIVTARIEIVEKNLREGGD